MKRKGFFFTLLLAMGLIGPVAAVRSQATSTHTPLNRPAFWTGDVQSLPTGQIIIKFVDEFGQQALAQQDLNTSLLCRLAGSQSVTVRFD